MRPIDNQAPEGQALLFPEGQGVAPIQYCVEAAERIIVACPARQVRQVDLFQNVEQVGVRPLLPQASSLLRRWAPIRTVTNAAYPEKARGIVAFRTRIK